MKLPRFHLSTLLLLCVFTGATIGLCFAPPVWKNTSGHEFWNCYQRLNEDFNEISGPNGPARNSYNARFDEEARFDYETRILSISLIDKNSGAETIVVSTHHPESVCALAYSKDGQYLFKDTPHLGMEFYRRTRSYGLRGFFEIPLFWIAVLSFLMLLIVAVRRLRKSAPTSAKSGPPA